MKEAVVPPGEDTSASPADPAIVEQKERARLLMVVTLVCLLHAPLDFAFTAPESWPLLTFHRVLWVLAFLAGALITRRGSPRTLLWTATGLGILSVFFTLPLVHHSGMANSPFLVWLVAYPALATTIVPTELRAVIWTSTASLAGLLWVFATDPSSQLVTYLPVCALISLVCLLSVYRARRITEARRAATELATRAEERLIQSEARRTQAEKVLETQRLATVGSAAAGVAHDLRNYVQTLQFALEVPEEPGALDDAREATNAIQALCSDMLTSLNPPTSEPTLLGPIIQSAMRIARGQTSQCRIEHDLVDVVVSVNRGRLVQVVVNLLTNAAQNAGPGSFVRVTTRQSADHVHVHVDDDGPGVPEELRARIFDPFFTTRPDEGTGLGLHVCQRHVEQVGGRLYCGDSPLGGARFTVELPLTEPEAP